MRKKLATSFRKLNPNSRGQSLVQIMVSVAIMGIMMAVFASMITSQSRETLALTQKLAVLDFQQQLTRSFADGSLCTNLLANLTVPSSGTLSVPKTSIPISSATSAPTLASAGNPLSPLTTSVTVAQNQPFTVTGITAGGVGVYSGNFQVNLNQTTLVSPLHPPSTVVTLYTNASQMITSCTTQTATPSTPLCNGQSMPGRGDNCISAGGPGPACEPYCAGDQTWPQNGSCGTAGPVDGTCGHCYTTSPNAGPFGGNAGSWFCTGTGWQCYGAAAADATSAECGPGGGGN